MYLMNNKFGALDKFRKYKALVENQTSNNIKTPRSDHGGEYMNVEFDLFLKKHGIVSLLTLPVTP